MDEFCKINNSDIQTEGLKKVLRLTTTKILTTAPTTTTISISESTILNLQHNSSANYTLKDISDLLKRLGIEKGKDEEDKADIEEHIDAVFSVVSSISVESFGNVTDLVQTYLSRHVNGLSQYLEFNILFTVLIIGFFLNFINIFVIHRFDKQMPRNMKCLNAFYILLEDVFLGMVAALVLLRKYYDQGHNLEIMNYFTCAFGVVWLIKIIFFNFLMSKIYCGVFNIWRLNQLKRKKIVAKKKSKCNIIISLVFLYLGLSYFVLYLPPIRLLINEKVVSHDVCNIPVENYWDLYDMSMKTSANWFFLLLYPYPYILFLFILPVFTFLSTNIRIIGRINRICDSGYKKKEIGYLNYSVVISTTCNVWTCCMCIKIVPALLYCVEFVLPFIGNGQVFLTLLNGIGNFLIVFQTCSHLFITALYNRNINKLIKLKVYILKKKLKRLFSQVKEDLLYYYYLEY